MQGILNERAMLYELIENIKMNNPEEQTSKAMKILKTLYTATLCAAMAVSTSSCLNSWLDQSLHGYEV